MGLFNWFYRWLCDRVFDQVDYNKNGTIEDVEVEVAILKLYNIVNKRLPGWSDPPKRADILAALKAFDVDGNGALDKDEFEKFAGSLMKTGPDAFFARVGKNAVINTAMLPAASIAVQQIAKGTQIANVPLVVLAPAIGVVFKSVRGLLPF